MKKLPLSLITFLTFAASSAFATTSRVLFLVTSADQIILRNGNSRPTGYFLNELTEPLMELKRRGVAVDFATPGGVAPTIDPASLNSCLYFTPFGSSLDEALAMVRSEPGLQRPLRLESLTESQLSAYDGIFVPGGHGAAQDLVASAATARVLTHFHARGVPTGLICHGLAALLSTNSGEGFLYAGYRMTAFSTAEEKWAEWTTLKGPSPFYADQELVLRGALIENVLPPFRFVNVVNDRELITGQNPFSAQAFARVFADAVVTK